MHCILEELYARGIMVLAGLSYEELFDFLLIQDACADAQEPGADGAAGSPPTGKGKAPGKKHAAPHPAPASPGPELAVPSKRPRQSDPGLSTDASILSSLLEVKSALSIMNARLNSLELAMPCKQPGPFFCYSGDAGSCRPRPPC